MKAKEIYKIWVENLPNIPRISRYTYGDRVDTLFLEFLEKIYAVSYMPIHEKSLGIRNLISTLDTLRFLFQLGYETRLITEKKYIAISTPLVEIGKMLGGWKKGLDEKIIKTPAQSKLL
ncbi:MAG: four helix bundle protein [Candidatus Pacebacteria bacterium]|nr:four helix bundle protein [Candidatus Paceibacterota bacterium]